MTITTTDSGSTLEETTTDSGFTLVETMMVLLLMGIAASLALPSLGHVGPETRINSVAARLMGDLRYAQNLAIRTQQTHTVQFDPTNEVYRVVDENGAIVQHPLTRQGYQVDFTTLQQFQGVDLLSATFGGVSDVSFDALGAPQSGGTVTLSYAGKQRLITVVFPTGRVVVQ